MVVVLHLIVEGFGFLSLYPVPPERHNPRVFLAVYQRHGSLDFVDHRLETHCHLHFVQSPGRGKHCRCLAQSTVLQTNNPHARRRTRVALLSRIFRCAMRVIPCEERKKRKQTSLRMSIAHDVPISLETPPVTATVYGCGGRQPRNKMFKSIPPFLTKKRGTY